MKRVSLVLLAFLLLVGTVFMIPKTVPHPMNETMYQAHYWGIRIPGFGYLFGGWGAVSYISPEDGGRWRYEFVEEGYNEFKGYYPDGTLREEGEC